MEKYSLAYTGNLFLSIINNENPKLYPTNEGEINQKSISEKAKMFTKLI